MLALPDLIGGCADLEKEHMQVLHYSVGQHYTLHHDYIDGQENLPCGPRALTFFIYLSDVDGGGETEFPHLNISVTPKRGQALMWDNIHPDTRLEDRRTEHIAHDVVLSNDQWRAF